MSQSTLDQSPSVVKPVVAYDRSAKLYTVTDTETGEVVETFPSGEKAAAEQYAVALANPRLARIINTELLPKRPYLQARAWRAAELVEAKAVSEFVDGPYFAVVKGSGDTYGLGLDETGTMTCTCADYYGFGAPMDETGQRWCKHLIAYHMVLRLRKYRCYHCEKLVAAEHENCPHCGEIVTPF